MGGAASSKSKPTKKATGAIHSVFSQDSSKTMHVKVERTMHCDTEKTEHSEGSQSSSIKPGLNRADLNASFLSNATDSNIGEDAGYLAFTEGTHKWKFSNGDIYYGEWKNGMMHGKGTLNVVNQKAVYQGAFEYNEFNGKGVYVYSNGNIFKGTFKNGYRQGRGHMDYADGSSMKGVWSNGRKMESDTAHSISAGTMSPQSSPGAIQFNS